jgi:hypothetical protein
VIEHVLVWNGRVADPAPAKRTPEAEPQSLDRPPFQPVLGGTPPRGIEASIPDTRSGEGERFADHAFDLFE